MIASSPEYRITCLREAVPEPLKLVITGTNGEDSGWDGVKPVETAVVDFVNKTADRLKFVVTYWNLNDDGTIIKDYTLDYALTMDHPELITPGSVYLDVYCNESAEDPTVWTVPLARNPITGDYEGTLTFPGGTITANDMPYYVYVGYGYTPSESAVALDEAYLTQLADTAADDLQAIFDAAREENDLYDMDVDLDMVELLLETDLAELPAEHKQLIREVTVNMKELAELHRETMLGVAADTSALQLLLSDGLTTGTCEGLDEAALLGMGAKKLETKNGTMFSLVGDETAILYDPANNVSVRVDAGALNEALSGADPALMSEDVLASLSAAAAYDAALMEEDKDYVAMANELAVLRNRILAVLDLVESVIDHFAAPTLQEMAALDNQAALTKNKYEEVLKDTLKAMKDPTTSNQMYQELSRDLARYDKVAREAKAAANEAKLLTRFKIFGYIKGALTGLRSGLLSNSTNISFALQTQKTLTELRNGVKSTSTLSSTIKNIFRAGGVVLGLLGIAIDVCSVVSAYGDLQNSFERYKNVDRLIDKGQKRLGWAFYEMYYLQLREDVLQKHGMTAQQQYDKGMAVWHKMTQDNIEVYSNRLTDFKMCYICGTCVNILGMLSALTGNPAVVAGIVSSGTLAQAQWGVTGAITLMMAESELDEDWEDYYEHVVGPVGSKKDDNDDDDSDEGDGSRRSGNTNSGSSRGGQGAHTPTAPQIDPAGYVYEAVASNRLSGVTVKASYLKDGEEVYWDDADFYDEVNPQITDETGTFSWYTPMGKWKVRAEKEGYAPADSENDPAAVDGWLPVPPPQMDVYIPMISRAAPTVESILAALTEIRITFSKYMQAAQLAEDPGLVSAAMDGEAVETVFRFADLEESPALPGVFYGRTLVLTPADGGRFGGENVQVSIGGGFMSYAGTAMGADYASGTVKIQPLAAEIRVLRSGTLSTDVGTRRTVCVQVLDTEGNPMKDAAVSADSSTGKLQVSGTDAVTDASGMASVTVSGLSSGPDTLTFSAGIAEAELSARVSLENQVSPASSALVEARNVASGEAGVQLTAVVENDTDLPTVGTLIAAVYLDGRFLASSLLPGLTVLPGDSAEAPMEVLCHASGDVTVKVFYVAADSLVPLAANAN